MVIVTRKGLSLPIALGTAAILSGCVIPEHLDANVLMQGYRYEVVIQGRLAEPRTIGALAKGQKLPANHDEKMRSEEAAALQLPGMVHFAYMGDGRYEFAMQFTGELSKPESGVGFPDTRGANTNFLTIRRDPDGTVLISTTEVPKKAVADLNAVGIRASGRISIEVQGTITESTADEQPAGGPHIWNRKSWEDRVYLKFDPNGR